MECFFIVKFFDFNSLNFCIFSHIDLIHILLDLYLTFQIVVLDTTLESPLDRKEIQAVHPKGDWSWVFIGRTDAEAETPTLWPPDAKC